jgi:hypothetical protein
MHCPRYASEAQRVCDSDAPAFIFVAAGTIFYAALAAATIRYSGLFVPPDPGQVYELMYQQVNQEGLEMR